MNPNNPSTKKSPWILCQSKSTPGKFYYFNVVTGVQAWCEDYERVRNEQRARNIANISRISLDRSNQKNHSDTYYTTTHGLPDSFETPTTSYRQPIYSHSPPRKSQFDFNVYEKQETIPNYCETSSTSYPLSVPSNPKHSFRTAMSGSSNVYEKSLPVQEHPSISQSSNSNNRDIPPNLFRGPIFPRNSQEHKLNSTELKKPNFYVNQVDTPEFGSKTYENTPTFHQPYFPPSLVDGRPILPPKHPNIHNKLVPTDPFKESAYTLRITVNNQPKDYKKQDVTENYIKTSTSCRQSASLNPSCGNQNRTSKSNTYTKQESTSAISFKPAPIFGQAVFSRYVTNEPGSNILWAPIQIPTVILQNPQESNSRIDRDTQTSQEYEESIVQACDIPLSKRFTANRSENICSGIAKMPNDHRILTRSQIFDIAKQNVKESFISNEEPVLRIPNRVRFQSENNTHTNDEHIYEMTSFENLEFNKLQLRNSTPEEVDIEDTKSAGTGSNLGSNDLRYLISAKKKRKKYDEEGIPNFEGKKIKTYKDDQSVADKPKKRVSFLLQDENSAVDDITDDDDDDLIDDDISQRDIPKLQAVIQYVLVDANTFIDEFEAIDRYIQTDDNLRLLVTERLRSDVEALCFGDCGGQRRVIFARKITRRFLTPPPCYVFGNDLNMNNSLNIKHDADILTCCIQLIRNGLEAVLISNDQKIISEAKTFDIRCFKTSELSNLGHPKPEITFDFKKINVTENDCNIDVLDLESSAIQSNSLNNKDHHQNFRKQSNIVPFLRTEIKKVNANTSPVIVMNTGNKIPNQFKESFSYEKRYIVKGRNDQNLYTDDYNQLINSTGDNIQHEYFNEKQNAIDRLGAEFETQNDQAMFAIAKDKTQISVFQTNKAFNELDIENSQPVFAVQNSDLSKESNNFKNNSNIQAKKVLDEAKVEKPNSVLPQSVFKMQNEQPNFEIQKPQSKFENQETRSIFDIQDQTEVNVPNLKTGAESQLNRIDDKVDIPKPLSAFKIQSPQITKELDLKDNFITKKVVHFEQAHMLDNYLETFEVKSHAMHERIRNRLDEWACSFTQIIEDALTQVLMKNKIYSGKITQLDILHDLILGVEELDVFNNELKLITNKFISLYTSECDRNGKLSNYTKPDDFIQLFGCGMVLIQELKDNNPTCQELFDAGNSLSDILEILECPQMDEEMLTFETPKFNGKEIDFEKEKLTRNNFVKKRSDVIKYLKAHFEDWENFVDETQQNDNQSDVKIVRTVGRNLSLLKLDNKNMTMKNSTEIKPATGNTEDADQKATNNVAITKNTGNVTIEKAETLNLDVLDYSEGFSNVTELSSYNENEKEPNDMSLGTISFVYDIKVVKNKNANETVQCDKTSNVDILNVKDDSKVDSGIGNESIQAHSLVKMFLTEISATFKAIYTFIDISITQLKEDEIQEDKMCLLRERANKTHQNIAYIIKRLKSIIQREANERTALKEILLKAGIEASTDKKITKYGQVVTKCLEQAKILDSALKAILSVTDGDCRSSLSSDSSHFILRYFNIFE